jgi:hypothetical protein
MKNFQAMLDAAVDAPGGAVTSRGPRCGRSVRLLGFASQLSDTRIRAPGKPGRPARRLTEVHDVKRRRIS